MADINFAAPTPPPPPKPPNLKSLDPDEIAGVVEKWKKMAKDFQVQADKLDAQADKSGLTPEMGKQFKDASRQWHDLAQVVQIQADRMEKTAQDENDTETTAVDAPGVQRIEKNGHTIITLNGKTITVVPSINRDRSVRAKEGGVDVVAVVFIVFLFLFLIVKAIMGPIHRRRAGNLPAGTANAGPGLSAADSATLQKIHRTLGQMERRVEALETILADPRRTAAFTTVTRPSTATPTTSPSTSYESKV